MKFRTETAYGKGEIVFRPDKPLILTGSCFADNMGRRMRESLWDARNPLGVLFNPLSIARVLELMLFDADAESRFAESLFESGGIWHSWLFDSSFSSLSREEIIDKFMAAHRSVRECLAINPTIAITFGTAYCYWLRNNGSMDNSPATCGIVANCHKQPPAMFTRRRVAAEEITGVWKTFARRMRERYPDMRMMFTVSPVRHVRDGLHENNLSKATLLLAIDSLCSGLDFCYYFPAYEIVNDDLRDYRFYAADLVHPSETAVDYIWEIFTQSCLDDDGRLFIKEGRAIAKRMNHRPILSDGEAAERFREETRRMYADFKARYPECLSI